MRYRRNILVMTAGTVLAALLSQCSHRGMPRESPPEPLPAVSAPAAEPGADLSATPPPEEETTPIDSVRQRYADITPEEIPDLIAALHPENRKSRVGNGDALVHLQLAWLYGHYKNPCPHYLKALQELDAYLWLSPEDGEDDFVLTWQRTLKEIGRLSRENRDLREKTEQLKKQVQQLKYLDIELEKKRQDIK